MKTLAELLRLAPPGSGAFAREFKGGAAALVMPGPAAKALAHSDSEMSITSVWTTKARDRQGDIVIPEGVDTGEHRINPVVLYHHGKGPHLPIGKAEDPHGRYTGRVAGDRLIGTTYFAQGNQFAEDVYKLARQDILRGMSIGFEPVEGHCEAIGTAPDRDSRPPLRFDRATLIEVSHTPIGVNREALTMAVRKALDGSAPLHRVLVKGLEPYALPKKAHVTVPRLPTQVNKAMNDTLDAPDGVDDIDVETGEMTADDAAGGPPPTAKEHYDAAQGVLDIVERLTANTARSEHVKSKKQRDRVIADAEALAEDLKALGDAISADVGGGTEPDGDEAEAGDMADPVPEEIEKAHDGRLVVKNYTPRRWGPLDVARAERRAATPPAVNLDADPDVIREEKAAEAKEARLARARRLYRKNRGY